MSDVDREAEKERLREQLEAEEESRRSTQHMSELLLKGATMTNAHCDTCGDPIFRYEGQEFCPTCQETIDEGGNVDPADGEADHGAQPSPDHGPDETAVRMDQAAEPSQSVPDATTASQQAAQPDQSTAPADTPSVPAEGDLGEARASLVRTLTALAQRAEATDDAGQARRLLTAAREAAETLAALDRAGR